MDAVAATRLRMLGRLIPIFLAALVAGNAVLPAGAGRRVRTTQEALAVLSAVDAHPSRSYVGGLLLLIGIVGFGAVAVPSFVSLVRRAGSGAATAAGVLAVVGALGAGAMKLWTGLDAYAVSRANVGSANAAAILVAAQRSSVASLVGPVGLILAGLLLGFGIWRSRPVAQWVGPAFGIGLLAYVLVPPGLVALIVGIPLLAASVVLTARLARTTESPASGDLSRLRRRTAAASGLAGLLLFLIGTALTPAGGDTQVQSTSAGVAALTTVRPHLTLLLVSGILTISGMMGMAAVFPVIASTIRGRGAALAGIGAALGAAGMACSALFNVRVYLDMYAVAKSGIGPTAGATFLGAVEHGTVAAVFPALGEFVVLPVSVLVMAVAIWRSRVAPRWLAVLLPVTMALGFSANRATGALVSVPFVVVTGYLVSRAFAPTPSADRATGDVQFA